MGLLLDLEAALGRSVDLVEAGAVQNPFLREGLLLVPFFTSRLPLLAPGLPGFSPEATSSLFRSLRASASLEAQASPVTGVGDRWAFHRGDPGPPTGP